MHRGSAARRFFLALRECCAVLPQHAKAAAELAQDVQQTLGAIWVFGNGGSASLADHFVCEIRKEGGWSGPAVAIASHGSLYTALSNDCGWLGAAAGASAPRDRDLVIALSVSVSPNVRRLIAKSEENGVKTWLICGSKHKRGVPRGEWLRAVVGPTSDAALMEVWFSAFMHAVTQEMKHDSAPPHRR